MSTRYMAAAVTESQLTLLTAWQANKSGDEVLRQGMPTLFGKLADQEDGGVVSPKNILSGSGSQFLL